MIKYKIVYNPYSCVYGLLGTNSVETLSWNFRSKPTGKNLLLTKRNIRMWLNKRGNK